ncbi:MAG: acyl-CoA desaturase [Polyangiaceae bacterium]|nr:acyl-CoA desaturase [Polyangiaceae bacterium]
MLGMLSAKNAAAPSPVVRFGHKGAFSDDLKREVDAYFDREGGSRRDSPRMYLKTAIIFIWFVGSWALLVFFATTLWQGVLLAMSLGLSIAAIGMGIQHDANHGGYSNHPWVNRLFGFFMDGMGVCGYIWRYKHNVIHHTYTNVQGVDFDLDFGNIARLSTLQTKKAWHKYQHYYLWFLYGLLLPKWVFYDDFVIYRSRLAGPHKLPTMNAREVALFWGWKVFFVLWSLVIPAMVRPIWQVLVFHLIAVFTLGVTLSSVFQLAHCVAEAEFPVPEESGKLMNDDWGVHQVETTVDFARDSKLLTWFLGGLNFQVEHHLFPKVCHVHYPELSKIVEKVAARHGVRYRNNVTLGAALASHFHHLRRLGTGAQVGRA